MTTDAEPTPRQHMHRLMWDDEQPADTAQAPVLSDEPGAVAERRARRRVTKQIMDGVA